MAIEKIIENGMTIAAVYSKEPVITDTQSALDLIMTARHELGAEQIVINKEAIAGSFFILSSGLAGEILQKFVIYHMRLAIYGDYSGYTSKPLHDFIYESNQGKTVFFLDTKEAAVQKLASLPQET